MAEFGACVPCAPEIELAAIVYVPGVSLVSVWVAVIVWLKPPGPVPVTVAATPLGSPLTVIVSEPVVGPDP